MSNHVSVTYSPDQIFLEGKSEIDGTLSVNVAGTAATVTDEATYAISDQSGLKNIITVLHDERPELNLGPQTVTYPASTTTALTVAAAINNQIKGVHVTVTGGHAVISSDAIGLDVTITIDVPGTSPSTITWGTPVAGTGAYDGVTIVPGTLLARSTATSSPYTAGDIVLYDSGNTPTGASTIRGMADFTATFTASGSKAIKMAIAGKVVESKISKIGGTVTQAEKDAMVANTGIIYASVQNGMK